MDKKQDEYLESLDQQLQTAETSSLQVWGGRELYYVDGVLMLFPPPPLLGRCGGRACAILNEEGSFE